MNVLAKKIEESKKRNILNVFWMGGAGFVLTGGKYVLGIDLYFSDACHGENDAFKRIIPAPLHAHDIKLDYMFCTHDHGDHFDTGSICELIISSKTKLIGPTSVYEAALRLGIKKESILTLNRDEKRNYGLFSVEAIMADHGDQAKDAIGLIINMLGKTVYFTGDTCYNADLCDRILQKGQIDLLVLPINGKYGNLNTYEAAKMVQYIKPKVAVPCHYWLFKEHGGDPGEFQEYCKELGVDMFIKILAIGENLEI